MGEVNKVSDVWCSHQYPSSDPFEFVDIIADLDRSPRQIFATLLRPERAQEPMPCVIALHGSAGWRGHHHEHMVRWLEQGIAVLRVHSFEARQVKDVIADQMAVTLAMMMADAFASLKLLQAIPAIDSANIGLAGWSLGGSVTLYAALESLAEKLAPAGGRFNAHLAFYPAAHIIPEEMRWHDAPLLVLTGKADDYTPAHYIEKLAPLMRAGGAQIEVVYYDDAHHSYDSPDPLTWMPDAIRLGKKFFMMDPSGALWLEGSDGVRHGVSTPAQRKETFARSKNVGAHAGVHWPARRASMDAAAQFLAARLL